MKGLQPTQSVAQQLPFGRAVNARCSPFPRDNGPIDPVPGIRERALLDIEWHTHNEDTCCTKGGATHA